MRLTRLSVAVAAPLVVAAAAQDGPTPAPGLWQVTTVMKNLMSERKLGPARKCLTPEAAARFDQFFTTPPRDPDRPAPSCRLNDLRVGEGSSTWRLQCAGPRGAMEGAGISSFSAGRYSAKQSFKMGPVTMTLMTTGARVGPC